MFDWDALSDGEEVEKEAPPNVTPAAEVSGWKVVAKSGAVARSGPSRIGTRAMHTVREGKILHGELEDGWLRLTNDEGFVEVSSDFHPFLVPLDGKLGGSFDFVDAKSILDRLAEELSASRHSKPTPKLQLEGLITTPAQVGEGEDHLLVDFSTAGGQAEGLPQAWMEEARSWLKRLDPKASVPNNVRLPKSAKNWEPQAAVLYALTCGKFDPRDVEEPATPAPFLSVCVATSDHRQSFHRLLYECFQKQTFGDRELVVVHTGVIASETWRSIAESDKKVRYFFFPSTSASLNSPRLSDEVATNPFDAVLTEDDPKELAYWEHGSPWNWEVEREGWTKGLKRNVACCLARGQVIAHFDDGCLYAPEYLSRSVQALLGGPSATFLLLDALREAARKVFAGAASTWFTVSVADNEFRIVDMSQPEPLWELYGKSAHSGQYEDRFNHGFNYIYTRAAWKQQPLPDKEVVGTQDADFLKALVQAGSSVKLLKTEPLSALGWHRDATIGAKDVPANINDAVVLDFLRFRGRECQIPKIFQGLLPSLEAVAATLKSRREQHLTRLVERHGPVYVCTHCNFAVALKKNADSTERTLSTRLHVVDGYELTKAFAKEAMKFDVAQISSAGGAVAEGHWQPPPPGNTWLQNVSQRAAICRNCGFQLGWRFEPNNLPKECASPCCIMTAANGREYCCASCRQHGPYHHSDNCDKKEAPKPQNPVSWVLVRRHLRLRKSANEAIPKDDSSKSRHKETSQNAGAKQVCPAGHPLHRFCTGQGNGGALPYYYICDICDRPARGAEHLWGCGTCDYDMCDRCWSRRQRVN